MSSIAEAILAFRFGDLPSAVTARARHLLLDLSGVAASGRRTRLAGICADHAVRNLGDGEGGGCRILFDGRRASMVGAAFAGAGAIDAFDAHDGHALTKGHAGVAVFPALLAAYDGDGEGNDRDFLTDFVLGYEIATRAGIALHASVSDYHTSGAWNALACAALLGRRLGLSAGQMREALGIAEYHGPRSQMMRCIAHPTMVKDGSDWGALAGVSAALLAADGFTGAPALTVEATEHAPLWSDLGSRWRILEQYLKPYPVCRWAQPAVEAVADLMNVHGLSGADVVHVEVRSFSHAVALAARAPRTTEEAQYSLPFPVAARIVRGALGAAEITGEGLSDEAVLRLARDMTLVEEPAFTARFPAERLACVTIGTRDGRRFASEPTRPRGDPDAPLGEAEVEAKFDALAAHLAPGRAAALKAAVSRFGSGEAGLLPRALDLLLSPLSSSSPGTSP